MATRWLWLGSLLMLGRGGGGISDDIRLGIWTGVMDGCLEELLVDTNFGFGVEDAARMSPVVMSVNSLCIPRLL